VGCAWAKPTLETVNNATAKPTHSICGIDRATAQPTHMPYTLLKKYIKILKYIILNFLKYIIFNLFQFFENI